MLLSYYLYAIRTALGVKEIYPTKQGGSEWYFGEFVDKGSVHEAWQMVSILYSLERWQSIDYRWVWCMGCNNRLAKVYDPNSKSWSVKPDSAISELTYCVGLCISLLLKVFLVLNALCHLSPYILGHCSARRFSGSRWSEQTYKNMGPSDWKMGICRQYFSCQKLSKHDNVTTQ